MTLARGKTNDMQQPAGRVLVRGVRILLSDLAAQLLQEERNCWTGVYSGRKDKTYNFPTVDLPDYFLRSPGPARLFLLVRTEDLPDGAVSVGACVW